MNMKNVSSVRAVLFLLALCSSASGCAGTYKQQLDFDPAEPLRVAVLPFVYVDDSGKIIPEDADLLVDKIGLVSSELGEKPTSFVQSLVTSNLKRTSLDIIPPAIVENALLHNGLGHGIEPDLARIYAIPPKDLCQTLGCDALVYGYVSEWDRSYYVAQSVSSVGIEVKIVNASTGKVLYTAKAEDSTSRGITKGPTGWASLGLEPIKGLDNSIITDLTRTMVQKMLNPLAVKQRPEVLEEAPPAVFASSHDSRNGQISRTGGLTVLAFGTPGIQAAFSIGDKVLNVPMVEKEKGHYIGEYFPLPGEKFGQETVKVTFTDTHGRTVDQIIGVGPVTVR